MTAEQLRAERLEELLGNANTEKWVRGVNDYGNPVARLNYGGVYGTSGDGFKDEIDLLMLAPSLARRVIELEKRLSAAEKLVEAGRVMANALKRDYIVPGSAKTWDEALAAYREINP